MTPINESALYHAARQMRLVMDRAERGDLEAQRALVRSAAADAMEATLKRLAHFADKTAPSLEEIRLGRGIFPADACALRFEIGHVAEVLAQAAGRATVIDLDAVREEAAP